MGTFPNLSAVHRKLAGIIVGLAPFPEQHGLKQFLNNEDHIDMLTGFVDDLARAISDYQV